jgi:CBS domain containing-hemolysin-like protein
MGLTAYVVGCGVLLFASASFLFALAESSLSALGSWPSRQLADRPNGKLVLQLLQQPAELLATISLGNTVANSALVALTLWPALKHGWPLALPVLAALALVLVGCEVLPKALAVRAPERWASILARPMIWLQAATRWFQRLVHRLNESFLRAILPKTARFQSTDEDYRELLDMAYQQGTLAQSEKEIILQIISLDRKAVRDVLRPRAQMAAIPDDLSVEDMIAAARKFKHRRLPIYDETPDTIVGILNTHKLLLDPHADLAEVIEFPSFVPASMNLLELLKSLQRQRRGLAIVLDEFGGTDGVVTIEDILEEVVGEIRGETESVGFVMEKLGAGRWRVNGTMSLRDFRREYPELGARPGVDTMGGLMLDLLEVAPGAGQSVVFGGLRLTAQVTDERRVKELLVEIVKKK